MEKRILLDLLIINLTFGIWALMHKKNAWSQPSDLSMTENSMEGQLDYAIFIIHGAAGKGTS